MKPSDLDPQLVENSVLGERNRTDVAAYVDDFELSVTGWSLRIPLEALSRGERVFEAHALIAGGRYVKIPN